MKNPFMIGMDNVKQEALQELNEIPKAESITAGQIVIDIDGYIDAGYEDCEEKVFNIVGKEVSL